MQKNIAQKNEYKYEKRNPFMTCEKSHDLEWIFSRLLHAQQKELFVHTFFRG